MTVPTIQQTTGLDERFRVRDALAEWLKPYDWSHFGDLTRRHDGLSKGKWSEHKWAKDFKLFIRRLENVNQQRVNYAYNIERTHPEHVHLQILLGNISDSLTIQQIRSS